MTEPSITDWISSIASLLGVPIILWGIIKLFIKDKAQERKLDSLDRLAVSQNEIIKKMAEQINELARQTSEYQCQSELMRESNNLINKQIELQNDIFLHSRLSEEKKLELQKMKRINDIKPYFVKNTTASSSDSITIKLKNNGNTASSLKLEKIVGEFISFGKLNFEKEIEKDRILEVNGNISSSGQNMDNGQRVYEFDLYFEDIDRNRYKQNISSNKVGKPELIDN